MNCGYDRHVIARGLDATRRYSIEEIAQEVYAPTSYIRSIIIERAGDFGDEYVEHLARAAGTTVAKVIKAGL